MAPDGPREPAFDFLGPGFERVHVRTRRSDRIFRAHVSQRRSSDRSGPDSLAKLVRRCLCDGGHRTQIGPVEPWRRLVPLVSCHGRRHLPRRDGRLDDQPALRRGARRRGCLSRPLSSLHQLWLACDHHFRRERSRNRQATRLCRAGNHASRAEGIFRKSDAQPQSHD